eukprot:scaffold7750_cov376-Prasinococcus_capsulatus_cf.AAC.1
MQIATGAAAQRIPNAPSFISSSPSRDGQRGLRTSTRTVNRRGCAACTRRLSTTMMSFISPLD